MGAYPYRNPPCFNCSQTTNNPAVEVWPTPTNPPDVYVLCWRCYRQPGTVERLADYLVGHVAGRTLVWESAPGEPATRETILRRLRERGWGHFEE